MLGVWEWEFLWVQATHGEIMTNKLAVLFRGAEKVMEMNGDLTLHPSGNFVYVTLAEEVIGVFAVSELVYVVRVEQVGSGSE